MIDNTCCGCRFWVPKDRYTGSYSVQEGECRRNPPVPVKKEFIFDRFSQQKEETVREWGYPSRMCADNGCGEYVEDKQ